MLLPPLAKSQGCASRPSRLRPAIRYPSAVPQANNPAARHPSQNKPTPPHRITNQAVTVRADPEQVLRRHACTQLDLQRSLST
jgi:hypothetical protein